MTLSFTDVARDPAHVTLHMHGYPAASNRRCARRTGKEVGVHVSHCRHDVLQCKFTVSKAGVPHELVLRRKSGEDHVAEVAVGDLLHHLV